MLVERVATWIGLLFIAALVCAVAFGEPRNGQDHLGVQQSRYDSTAAAAALNAGDATGNLDWTFGESMEPVEALLKTGPSYHRVHLLNGPCLRGGNCGKYEIMYGMTPERFEKAVLNGNPKIKAHVQARAILYRDLCARYPPTQCLVSPMLEHPLSKKAWRKLADWTLAVWSTVQLVNSPVGGIQIERYQGAWIERHGTKPQADADIVSTDGEEVTDTDIPAFLKRTGKSLLLKIRFAWSRVYNCRSNGPFLDPRKRTACPKPGNYLEIAHIFDDRGPAPIGVKPPGCAKIAAFKGTETWKLMSDDHGNGDKRANKPVLLLNAKVGQVTIVATNGVKVGQIPLYNDPNSHSVERYYSAEGSNLNGYSYELLARAQSNSSWAYINAKKTCTGPFIPGRRAGTYK